MKVKIVNNSNNPLPEYKTSGAAGFDLMSNEEDFILVPGESRIVKTGIFVAIPEGYEMQIRSRSGMAAKHGIIVRNQPGTIDCITEDSLIRIDDKKEVPLKDIINDKINFLVSKNEKTGELEEKEIERVWEKGEQEIFEVELKNGLKVKLTGNHIVYTKNGLKMVNMLNIEDDVEIYT